MAALSVTPAVGLVPRLASRARVKYAEHLLAAMILLAAKLAGFVVERMVYGPQFKELGSVDADWRNAQLMITVFWGLTVTVSMAGLIAGQLQLPSEGVRAGTPVASG